VTNQHSRGAVITKTESGGGVIGQHSKVGQMVDAGDDIIGQRAVFKTELSHLARGGADQTGNTAAAW
jgi:hypothetical protein